ncbi:unnamed protein product [Candidula unifasciata]|uniref:RING-type E3 ubiquitin transferase n=1 Tax=Candidula unifasciata TaxID=100452 RepID=A0A8S3Z7K2_9EUPU|nr:unnamed protein product [Candidula unifasciata]
MADVVDKVLGVSSAVSGVVSLIFYKLYRNRTETARQVRQIPVWNPDLDLQDHLNMQDNQSLAYAAVEGLITDMGRTLRSHHGDEKGVVMRSQIVEHKSKRINGFWSDMKKVIRDNTEMVPFAISKPGGDPRFRVEVTDARMATQLEDDLQTTYDRFEPSKASLVQVGLDRLFGEVTKGIQETEQMLLTGTSVLGVGKIFLHRGEMKLGPPDDSSRMYIITKMRLLELVRHYESQSTAYKIMAIIAACIGGGLLAYVLYRHTSGWLEKRRQRLEFDEIRRSIAEQRQRSQESRAAESAGEASGLRDEDTCVVCLANARQVIALPCGHLATCADCAETLPFPKMCPVCRADVDRFLPVYRP